MTIQEFVQSNANAKVNSDIAERWESRIVAQGMHLRGRAGAENYLGQYGKGLKAPKAIALARVAEVKGFPEMAARFWEEAFFLATGQRGHFTAGGSVAAGGSVPAVVVKEAFGRTPQLPVVAEAAEVERLLLDDNQGMQEKVDGRNAMLDITPEGVSGGNKRGLAAHVPLQVADEAVKLGRAQLDAEDVGGVYHVFDATSISGMDVRNLGYADRHALLVKAFADSRINPTGALRLIPLVQGRKAKLAFREELRARNAEGFILKRLDARYESGDRHGNQVKSQFRATNAFIVGARNGLKSSVAISVHRADGSLRDMGNLTIPGKTPIPEMGSVVEVEYLYCHPGAAGKLHQPVFKGVRDDYNPADCHESKLKVKAEMDGDE